MSIRAGLGYRSVLRHLVGVAAAAALLAPQQAIACAMCLSVQATQREAYYVTTLILLAVPLGIAGAFGFWFYKVARSCDVAESEGRPKEDSSSRILASGSILRAPRASRGSNPRASSQAAAANRDRREGSSSRGPRDVERSRPSD